MSAITSGLVDIVREFLAVDRAVSRLAARFRAGELRFEEVQALISDTETSALFRLKERCHTLFRQGPGHLAARHREVLFDLAVGSLFHEAMKFRENFYQREVYGPRVQALRDEAGEEAVELFNEFAKIQGAASERLEEGLHETEALLARTREQLDVLLAEAGDGHVSRFLLERRELAELVFQEGLDELLARIHGDAAAGYAVAGRSYLLSGYYLEAERALNHALERGGDVAALEPAIAYARGMAAYLRSDYRQSVSEIGRWAERSAKPEPSLLSLALAAMPKIGDLAQGEDRDGTVVAARALVERLTALRRSNPPLT